MLILAINTASSNTSIALFERGKTAVKILTEKSWPAKNNEAEKLMPEIAEQFKKLKKTYSDLKEILVVKGPGSFTGLRVGITVANTIAYLTKAKLFAISTFEYWHLAGNSTVMVYAGSGGVYVSESAAKKPQFMNLEEASNYLSAKKIKKVSGDITNEQKSFFKNITVMKSKKSFAKIIKLALSKQSTKKLKPLKIVEPLYIKEPSITQSKKPRFH